jgi:hypothetical protein
MRNLYICDRDYLPFIFPEYQIVEHSTYIKSNQIYVGADKVPGDSEAFSVVAFLNRSVALSLPDNAAVVTFAFERKGKPKVPKYVERRIPTLEREAFMRELKYFMATGSWKNFTSVDVKVYQMFAALLQDKKHFLNLYFRLVDQFGFEHMWESMLTFFRRVLDTKADLHGYRDYYRKLILGFRVYSNQIYELLNLFFGNHFNEVTVLDFLMKLRTN